MKGRAARSGETALSPLRGIKGPTARSGRWLEAPTAKSKLHNNNRVSSGRLRTGVRRWPFCKRITPLPGAVMKYFCRLTGYASECAASFFSRYLPDSARPLGTACSLPGQLPATRRRMSSSCAKTISPGSPLVFVPSVPRAASPTRSANIKHYSTRLCIWQAKKQNFVFFICKSTQTKNYH